MRALDRKLLRNLRSMRGQVIAIMLIIACGVASFVTVLTAYRGLNASRDSYYRKYRLADLWANVKRAPRSAALDLEAIEGVRRVEARIVFEVTIDLPELSQPCTGRVLSVPDQRRAILNDLHLLKGDWFLGDGTREVIVAHRFADAHGLKVGDELNVLMNNRKKALRIVATAQSPEFVYMIGGGDILPDHEFFTVLWLSESFAESVFDFEDACNEFVALLDRDRPLDEIVDRFDARLDRYGAIGAYGRKDQISARVVNDEIEGLRGTATMVPTVFLGVAAFVLHMLMGRLVRTQRGQISVLRAFGYSTGDLIVHFLMLTLLIAVLGALLGIGLGLWFAHGMVGLYLEFYSFPELDFSANAFSIATGLAVSLVFAVIGTVGALRAVARLGPAEGMRPEAPRLYKRMLFERMRWLWARLGFGTRMVLRRVARTKLRSAVTVLGIAMATSLLVLAFFGVDSTEVLMDVQFRLVERQDARIMFHDERGRAALYELRRLDGVRAAEPELNVPVRLVKGWRSRRSGIQGLEQGQDLHALLDQDLNEIALPRTGLLLTRKLAELVGARVGDEITVEVLTGRKPTFRAPITSVVDEYLGTAAYADIDWLSRRLGEEHAVTGALISIDPARAEELGRTLKNIPAVAGVGYRARTIKSFKDTLAQSQNIMNTIMILFAGTIVFGVLYNAARISLAERERELGSLRVLGFTTREVSNVLVGENMLLVVLGLLPGIGLGASFCWLLTRVYDTDLFRFPFVLRPDSIFVTIVVVVVFALLANFAVLRRLRRLDIVEVLKARE